MKKLQIDQRAPDFTLPGVDGKEYSLKAFEGNPHVGLHVALGNESGSVPSANLEPRP